jgi:RNA polymerase sigma factor for flagellar operon FliA
VQLGRWPSAKEIAFRLGMSPDEVRSIQAHASSRFISLESALQERSSEGSGQRLDPPDDDDLSNPAAAAEHLASLDVLRQAVGHLNRRDQEILQLRYTEGRPFHEVGTVLGLSESRVCQLHKRILRQLKKSLASRLDEAA